MGHESTKTQKALPQKLPAVFVRSFFVLWCFRGLSAGMDNVQLAERSHPAGHFSHLKTSRCKTYGRRHTPSGNSHRCFSGNRREIPGVSCVMLVNPDKPLHPESTQ